MFPYKDYSDALFDRLKIWQKIEEAMCDIQKVLVLQLAASDLPIFSSVHHGCKIAWLTWASSQGEWKTIITTAKIEESGDHDVCRLVERTSTR